MLRSTASPRLEKFIISLVVLTINAGAIGVMSFVSLPPANKDVVFQLVGGVNALAGIVVGGYFSRSDRPNPPKGE